MTGCSIYSLINLRYPKSMLKMRKLYYSKELKKISSYSP